MRAELKSANRESFPYIMHIVDEPRKFSPSNVLTYTVYKSDTNLMDVLQLLLIMKNLAEQIHFSAEFES